MGALDATAPRPTSEPTPLEPRSAGDAVSADAPLPSRSVAATADFDPPPVDRSPPGPSSADTSAAGAAPLAAELSPAQHPSPARTRHGGVALLEVIDRDGHVRQAWPVEHWPAQVGRSLDNDIVLTDPHVAPHHFRLEAGSDGPVLRGGATRNGVLLEGRRIDGGAVAPVPPDAGDGIELVAGRTRLRLRLADAALAPEVPLATIAVRHLRLAPTLVLALLLGAAVAFNTYLEADPDNFIRVAGNTLLAGLSAAAVWCGAWALLSKTITRQGHFGWHLRVLVIAGLALLALAGLPGLVAFALSWPWLSDYSFVAVYAVAAAALYFHLLAVEPARPRLLRWVVATAALVGVALTFWFNLQRTGRIDDELYMSHLFPPALRLARPVSTERFVAGLAPLHARLDAKAREPASADALGATATNKADDDDDD